MNTEFTAGSSTENDMAQSMGVPHTYSSGYVPSSGGIPDNGLSPGPASSFQQEITGNTYKNVG